MGKDQKNQLTWYDCKWIVHLLLILIFPVGLYALWKSQSIAKWWKIVATTLSTIIVVVSFGPYDQAGYATPQYDTSLHDHKSLIRHQLPVNGCTLHYWIQDNEKEEWVVFLHGAGGDHRMFMDQVDTLATGFNMLLLDGRGHGYSALYDNEPPAEFSDMISDVVAVMDANNIPKVNLVAVSLGASLAQEVAFYHPERVDKMVLIGCYNQHGHTDSLWKLRNALLTTSLKVIPWEKVTESFGAMTSDIPAVRDYVTECLRVAGRENWTNIGLTAYETKHRVESYETPHETLLVRGENDYPEMLGDIYKDMLTINPKAKEVVIEASGHACNMENIQDVNAAIVAFLKIKNVTNE